jgi:hypothetical protein
MHRLSDGPLEDSVIQIMRGGLPQFVRRMKWVLLWFQTE